MSSPPLLIAFERYEDRRPGHELHPHRLFLRDYKQMARLAERLSALSPEFSALSWRKCYRIYEETIQCKYSPEFSPRDLEIMEKAIWDCLLVGSPMPVSYRKAVRDRLSYGYPMKKYTSAWNLLARTLQQRLQEERRLRRGGSRAAPDPGNAPSSPQPAGPAEAPDDGRPPLAGPGGTPGDPNAAYIPDQERPQADSRKSRKRGSGARAAGAGRSYAHPEEAVRAEMRRLEAAGRDLRADPSSLVVRYWPLYQRLAAEGSRARSLLTETSPRASAGAAGAASRDAADSFTPDSELRGFAESASDQATEESEGFQTAVLGLGPFPGGQAVPEIFIPAAPPNPLSALAASVSGSGDAPIPQVPPYALDAPPFDAPPLWPLQPDPGGPAAAVPFHPQAFSTPILGGPSPPLQTELSRFSSISLTFNSPTASFDGSSLVEQGLSARSSLCEPGGEDRGTDDGLAVFSCEEFGTFLSGGSMAKLPSMSSVPSHPAQAFSPFEASPESAPQAGARPEPAEGEAPPREKRPPLPEPSSLRRSRPGSLCSSGCSSQGQAGSRDDPGEEAAVPPAVPVAVAQARFVRTSPPGLGGSAGGTRSVLSPSPLSAGTLVPAAAYLDGGLAAGLAGGAPRASESDFSDELLWRPPGRAEGGFQQAERERGGTPTAFPGSADQPAPQPAPPAQTEQAAQPAQAAIPVPGQPENRGFLAPSAQRDWTPPGTEVPTPRVLQLAPTTPLAHQERAYALQASQSSTSQSSRTSLPATPAGAQATATPAFSTPPGAPGPGSGGGSPSPLPSGIGGPSLQWGAASGSLYQDSAAAVLAAPDGVWGAFSAGLQPV